MLWPGTHTRCAAQNTDDYDTDSVEQSNCPVLQCVKLPPCTTKISEISPGCSGCPVCADIAPYTRAGAMAVAVLPDLIVAAPTFVLAQAAQLKSLVNAAQNVYNSLPDDAKAAVNQLADKAVASAIDKLYQNPVPSANTAQAVSSALNQIVAKKLAPSSAAAISSAPTPTLDPPPLPGSIVRVTTSTTIALPPSPVTLATSATTSLAPVPDLLTPSRPTTTTLPPSPPSDLPISAPPTPDVLVNSFPSLVANNLAAAARAYFDQRPRPRRVEERYYYPFRLRSINVLYPYGGPFKRRFLP